MVLYHASTMYHLLCCIIHKLAYNKDEQSQLLMLEYIKPEKERAEFIQKLRNYGFFTTVRYVPEQQFKLKKGIALNEDSSSKDIEFVINNICTTFEKWFNDDIKKYKKIYVASDQHSCGIYLIKNKIPYVYMEDASGMLSEEKRYLSITKSNNLTNYIINEYLQGAGRSRYVTAKLCDLKHQIKGFHDDKAVDFSIYDTLKNVIPDKIPDMLGFFGNMSTSIKSDKKICLFLTQDLNTLKIKDIDLQELITTTVVDYMCPDYTLVIKPHPKDRWQNYRRILPKAIILPRGVPSELLPFAIDGNISMALTASSTSIRGVTEFADRAFTFTTEIETHRERIDSMFIASMVLKKIGITDGVKIQNLNETQMMNFLDKDNIKTDGSNVLIDGGLAKFNYIDFKNHSLTLCLNLGSILNYSPMWDISKFFIITAHFVPENGSLLEEQECFIFAECRNKELENKLKNLKFSINLEYTNAIVNVNCSRIDGETANKLCAKLSQDIEWEEK